MLTLRQVRFFLACIASGLVLGVGLTVLGPSPSSPIPAPAPITLVPTPRASPAPASPITEEPLGPTDLLRLTQLQAERVAAGQVETEANRPQLLASPSPYRGTNHFWYPAMGINHAVGDMACNVPAVPGASLYRWGCAGDGNTYLLSHFWAVLKPLYLGYEAGKLKVGQSVWYADGTGQVRHYVVTSWKDVLRSGSNGWAFAGSATPVITIQTCLDAAGTHLLVVRLNLAP